MLLNNLTISRYRDKLNMKGVIDLPVLSKFYGIIIRMYFQQSEHNPPHIHAIYSEDVAAIDIQTCEVLEGYLPPKALDMVKEWISIHREDLIQIWNSQEFKKLSPLE